MGSRRRVLAAAFLAAGASAFPASVQAEPSRAGDTTGSIAILTPVTRAPLHRLGADARQLLFTGETDARDFPVYLTAAEARSHAHLHLTTTNAVSVMAEASRMRVLVNDVPVSDTAIDSPTADDPGVLDIDLPASLLEPGYNAVRVEVEERHRVDCSLAATYELWTQIEPASAGFTFEGLAAWSLADIADLPALPPADDGTTPIRLVVPKGADARDLERLLKAVESVALHGRFPHPDVTVETAPADRPGLDIVIGTTDELRRENFDSLLPAHDAAVALHSGTTPGQSTLVLSGLASDDVDAAVVSLLPEAVADAPIGTPSGQRAIALAGGHPVEGGSRFTLRELGVPSQEFNGRLFRTGFDLLLPPDFYAADYGKLTLRVDAGYAAGLDRGSQILVRVNGRDAASLPLADRSGDVFRGRPITVPLGQLRPGLNRVDISAELGTASDRSCDTAAVARAAGGGDKRFVLLDSTTVELPTIARIGRLPNLAATAAFGFPYAGRKTSGQLYLPNPDPDAVAAAATLLGRAAVAAGGPIDARLTVGRASDLKGPVLVIGAFSDVPPAMLDAVGLDRDAMVGAWSHVDARSKAAARLRDAETASGRSASLKDLARGDARDGATLFRRWSDDVSAAQWRFDPLKLLSQVLQKAAGLGPDNLPHWSQPEARVAVTSDMRLAVAQHEAPGGGSDTWTLVVAPTGAALRDSVLALTAPDLWAELDGRVATLDPHEKKLGIVRAQDGDYFVPTETLTPTNLRLIAAGWLSNEIDVYVLGFVLVAIALGLATAATVKHYGVKP